MKDLNQIRRDLETLRDELVSMDYTDVNFNGTMEAILALKKELDAETEREADMITVRSLLAKHGCAYRIFTPDAVRRLLESAEDSDGAGRDIESIVSHVVEGDDWHTMSDYTEDDEANLYALIEGTRGDHPEWFEGESTAENEEFERLRRTDSGIEED
jgi:hypothetical protein